MTTLTRAEKLKRIKQAHEKWVSGNLEAASKAFGPSGYGPDSVYNQHHVDLDASGEALDEFAAMAAEALADPEEKSFLEQMAAKHLPGEHDQDSHGRHGGSAARWLSPDDAMAMRAKMLGGEPWTPQQQEALNRYVGSAYGEMNGLLRGDQDATADLSDGEREEFAGLIRDAAQGMRPTTEPVKVKRFVAGFESFGLDMSQLTREEAAEALKAMKGKTLQEPGFMSTSLLEDYGKDTWPARFKLELDVPEGAQGAFLDSDVGFPNEQELLLAPGSRFEITDVVIDPPRNTVKGRVIVS